MALTKVTSGLISADASSVDLNIDAGTLYIDSTNNRVGVGTSSVDQKLHVEGSGTTAIKVETTADDYAIMQYKTSTSSLWQSFASPSNDYRIGISGVGDALTIDSSFNAGLGTSSPSGILHLYKSSGTTDLRIQSNQYSANYGFVGGAVGTNALGIYDYGASAYRFVLDSSGNVNIGTTAAATGSHKLVVESASTTGTVNSHIALIGDSATNGQGPQILFSESGDGQSYAGGTIGFTRTGSNSIGDLIFGTRGSAGDANTTTTERMKITSGGFIKASQNGTIYDSSGNQHEIRNTVSNNWVLRMVNATTGEPYGMEIRYPSVTKDNTANYFINCADSTTDRFRVLSDGDVLNHDNTYGSISDEKLKQDITDAGSQWDDIKNLRVRNFKFKSDVEAYGDDAKSLIGLVAQEAELVTPHLVKDNPDLDEEHNDLGTVTKSIKYSVLYMKAIKALQEAMTKIEDLEARIQTLEGE